MPPFPAVTRAPPFPAAHLPSGRPGSRPLFLSARRDWPPCPSLILPLCLRNWSHAAVGVGRRGMVGLVLSGWRNGDDGFEARLGVSRCIARRSQAALLRGRLIVCARPRCTPEKKSAWACGLRHLPSGAGRDRRWCEARPATAASSAALGTNPVGL